MSEVKRGRGRPRQYATKKEYRAAWQKRMKNITIPRDVAELLWDCVAIKSQEIGIQLTTTQVVQMILIDRDWETQTP